MFLKCLKRINFSLSSPQRRFIKNLSLKFTSNGEPRHVLKMVEEELPEPNDFQVLIEVLLAPINPSDINIIQGKYPLQPSKFPATAGNEFVGQVVKMGKGVEKFVLDERVVAFESGLGTWSKYLLLDAGQLLGIPFQVRLPEAATLTINPCTAYRMLKDFVKLQPGDCIIQNGANSSVGQAVHQLCKIWGFKSVGVVRNRSDITQLKVYLTNLGATQIFTDDELLKTDLFRTGCLPKPRLALNCVGGESAKNIAQLMDYQGIMVTYGGMSKKPITMTTGPFIFKKHSFLGFWLSDWIRKNSGSKERTSMLNEIIGFIINGKFKASSHTLIPFEKYKDYSQKALNLGSNKSSKKFIFDMSENEECN